MVLISKLTSISEIMRLHSPAGYLLLFFPCGFVILSSAPANMRWHHLSIFLAGSVIMRSSGCIVNDLFDREVDKQVARTKDRPLASNKLSVLEALFVLFLLLLLALGLLFQLNNKAIYLSVLSLIPITIYPLMKRITNYPQIFLGFTFNLGTLIAALDIKNHIDTSDVLIYLGSVAWTVGYDIIYSFADYQDDLRAGVKSMTRVVQNNYRPVLLVLYSFFIACNAYVLSQLSGYKCINTLYLVIAAIFLFWQVMTLNVNSSHNCLHRFKLNIVVGALLMLAFTSHG